MGERGVIFSGQLAERGVTPEQVERELRRIYSEMPREATMHRPDWIGKHHPADELQTVVRDRDATIACLRAELAERSDRRAVLRERMARLEAEAEARDLREQVRAMRTQSRAGLEAEVAYLRDELTRLKRSRDRSYEDTVERLRVHCDGGDHG